MERTLMHVAAVVVMPALGVAPGASRATTTGRVDAVAETASTPDDAARRNPGAGTGARTNRAPSRRLDAVAVAVRANSCDSRRRTDASIPGASARRVGDEGESNAPKRTWPGTPSPGTSAP